MINTYSVLKTALRIKSKNVYPSSEEKYKIKTKNRSGANMTDSIRRLMLIPTIVTFTDLALGSKPTNTMFGSFSFYKTMLLCF